MRPAPAAVVAATLFQHSVSASGAAMFHLQGGGVQSVIAIGQSATVFSAAAPASQPPASSSVSPAGALLLSSTVASPTGAQTSLLGRQQDCCI